ncbi:Bcr/CflA family drug resistance efflux transporter [Serinibacter arcticus]|uniref:Bcr/CflA family drug resistance efflux transporter n=1 Tax=Serinibacter arcticus TaxID=1655435 RepID=A0A2U1ZTC7_9MICO|nr:multidrug effflux MFS transporter [Serinibacter arcticus]PWD50234.1 Bcr/CflA family drug resistance efflux transporter [Serinibacter arcticus]
MTQAPIRPQLPVVDVVPGNATGAVSTARAPRPRAALVGLLGAMSAVFAITVDMYLPSLPQVAEEMQVGEATAQLTISFMMFGAAFGQLVIGPWSDRVGRRRPVIIGAAVHIVACLAVLLGSGIVVFLGLRLMQGVGAAALGVCAQAFIRDRYNGPVAAATLSRLMLVIGVAPLFAPTVGEFIAHHWGWRAVFAVLAACGLLVMLAVWKFLPESHPVERRAVGGLATAMRNYRVLLADKRFLAFAMLPGLVSGALMAYVSGSPFVLQGQFGLTGAQFSMFFAAAGVLMVGMAQINAHLVHRYSPIRIIRVALPVQISIVVVLLVIALLGVGGLFGFLVPLALAVSLQNFVPPNATAIALGRHGERAGAAAAVCGALGALLPAAISPFVGVFGGTAISMAAVMLFSLTVALAVVTFGTGAFRRGGFEAGRD